MFWSSYWNKRVHEYYFSGAGIKYTKDRASEYVSNEMGISWGPARQILSDLHSRLPFLHIDSMLDFGAGTGRPTLSCTKIHLIKKNSAPDREWSLGCC